jgi:hypothetical protein
MALPCPTCESAHVRYRDGKLTPTYTIVCDDAGPDILQNDFGDSVSILRIPGWREL